MDSKSKTKILTQIRASRLFGQYLTVWRCGVALSCTIYTMNAAFWAAHYRSKKNNQSEYHEKDATNQWITFEGIQRKNVVSEWRMLKANLPGREGPISLSRYWRTKLSWAICVTLDLKKKQRMPTFQTRKKAVRKQKRWRIIFYQISHKSVQLFLRQKKIKSPILT